MVERTPKRKLMSRRGWIRHRPRYRYSRITKYNLAFNALRKVNYRNNETISTLDYLEARFHRVFHKYSHLITALSKNLNLASEISAQAKTFKLNKAMGAHTHGSTLGKRKKILICGAKGKVRKVGVKKAISTFALSEIVENYQNGISAAFASVDHNGRYSIDAKINEEVDNSKMNSNGELEISRSLSRKYLVHRKKISVGKTKIFRLLIGKDYVRLIVNYMLSGAAVRGKKVFSKSSITIKNYLSSALQIGGHRLPKITVKHTIGIFSSENQTDQNKSISQHKGYLMVQKDDSLKVKNAGSYARVDKNGGNTDAYYNSKESQMGHVSTGNY